MLRSSSARPCVVGTAIRRPSRGSCCARNFSSCMRSSNWFTSGRAPMVHVRRVCPPACARDPRCAGGGMVGLEVLRFISPSVADGVRIENVQFGGKPHRVFDLRREDLTLVFFEQFSRAENGMPSHPSRDNSPGPKWASAPACAEFGITESPRSSQRRRAEKIGESAGHLCGKNDSAV